MGQRAWGGRRFRWSVDLASNKNARHPFTKVVHINGDETWASTEWRASETPLVTPNYDVGHTVGFARLTWIQSRSNDPHNTTSSERSTEQGT